MSALSLHTFGSFRYRTELVDQDNVARRGVSHTARLRAGFATAPVNGFSLLAEGTAVGALGHGRASNAADVDPRYPTIQDPQNLDLTQAVLRFDANDDFGVQVGRQSISHGDQRFIGPSAFRQTRQSHDAVSLQARRIADWFIDYGYIWQVRRLVGRRASGHALDSDSHFLLASYRGFPSWSLGAHAYLFDVENDAFDHATYGANAGYGWRWRGAQLSLNAAAAYQRRYREQPDQSSHRYLMLGGGLRLSPWKFDLGFEQLGGDDGGAFQTPFATLHKFQGLSDQFLVTPNGGVGDGFLKVEYKISGARLASFADGLLHPGTFANFRIWGAVHEFRRPDIGGRLGWEWDLAASVRLTNASRISLQAASYHANGFSQDTDKLWLTLEAEF